MPMTGSMVRMSEEKASWRKLAGMKLLLQHASHLKQFDKDEIAFVGSPFATCEDNYVLAKFANSVIGSKHLDFMRHIDPDFR